MAQQLWSYQPLQLGLKDRNGKELAEIGTATQPYTLKISAEGLEFGLLYPCVVCMGAFFFKQFGNPLGRLAQESAVAFFDGDDLFWIYKNGQN